MALVLQPGLRLVRRDVDHLQLGVDPPAMVVLPDRPEVRRLVDDLARGRPTERLSAVATGALSRIVAAGLAHPVDGHRGRGRADAQALVAVEAGPETAAALTSLLAGAGLVQTTTRERTASLVLVVADTEVARARLDPLVREGVPHLVVSDSPVGLTVGPFVVPGTTACLRCVDAHRGEADPRRALVVEQVASLPPLVAARPDSALRSIALGWAVRDLVTFVKGGLPTTWSATVLIDPDLAPTPRRWLRHPHCGCAWGDGLGVVAG
jgi:hypothetical protein